jgi:hypothetical protein
MEDQSSMEAEVLRRKSSAHTPSVREEMRRPRHGHLDVTYRAKDLRADVYLTGDDPLHARTLGRRVMNNRNHTR